MGRIGLDDNLISAAVKMADGNPGAITVLGQLLKLPDGFISVLHLDDAGIYGASIWVCYKDLCQEDIHKLNGKLVNHTLKREWEKAKPKYMGSI